MSTTTPSSQDHHDEERFAEFLQNMIRGQSTPLAEALHPEVVWHLPPFARQGPVHGIPDVLKFLQEGAAAVYQPDSLSLEPEILSVREGKASCLATIRGRLRDGRPYENRYAFFARLADGRIAEVWEILDSALLLDQMQDKS